MKNLIKICFILVCVSFAKAELTETISTKSWIYKNIEELKIRGKLTKLDLQNLPLTKGEVAKAILNETWNENFGYEKVLKDELTSELETELNALNNKDLAKNFGVGLELEPKILNVDKNFAGRFVRTLGENKNSTQKDVKTKITTALRTKLGFSVNEHFGFYQKILLDGELKFQENFVGNERIGLRGYNESTYILANYDFFKAKIGRDFLVLGPGKTGKLLVSDNSRPFDLYSAEAKASFVKFSFFGIQLDNVFADASSSTIFTTFSEVAKKIPASEQANYFLSNRFLNGHRLDLTFLDGNLNFGITEIFIYTGKNRNFELRYVNPLNFYHGVQLNDESKGDGGNTVGSLDFDFYLKNKFRFYGGIAVDDFQIDKKETDDLEPNEISYLFGSSFANPLGFSGYTISAEYFRVANRTYNAQDKGAEKLLHRNQPISHSFGNNFELFYLQVSGRILPKLQADFGAKFYRKGDTNIVDPFNKDFEQVQNVESGYAEKFPFVQTEGSKVEKTFEYGLSLGYFFSGNLKTNLDVTFANTTNYQNQSGKKFSGLSYFKFGVFYDFYHLF